MESADGGPPVLDDIVFNSTAPTGQFQFTNTGQFKILYNKLFNLVNQDNNPAYQKMLKVYVKTSRRPKTVYNGILAKKFHYYLMAFSDTAAAGEIPDFRMDLTVRFTDS